MADRTPTRRSPEQWFAMQIEDRIPNWISAEIYKRAIKRIETTTITSTGPSSWTMEGNPALGDVYDEYQVVQGEDRAFSCSCHNHRGGGSKFRRRCSHVIAAWVIRNRGKATATNPPHPRNCTICKAYTLNGTCNSCEKSKAVLAPPEADNHHATPTDSPQEQPTTTPITQPAAPDYATLLPPWASSLRPSQKSAIEQIVFAFDTLGAQNVILQAPTGSGKTLIGYMVGRIMQARTNYIATTKPLQEQCQRDFPSAHLLKGRSNYVPAIVQKDKRGQAITCADCDFANGQGCSWCSTYDDFKIAEDQESETAANAVLKKLAHGRCPYQIEKRRAARNDLAILNTSYMLAHCNYAKWIDNQPGSQYHDPSNASNLGFGNRFSIWDEADEIEAKINDFCKFTISLRTIDKYMRAGGPYEIPKKNSRWTTRVKFLKDLMDGANKLYATLDPSTPNGARERDKIDSHIKAIAATIEKVSPITDDTIEDCEPWVYTVADHWISFAPVIVRSYAKPITWDHSPANLIMSATIVNPTMFAEDLGMDLNNGTVYVDVPSAFDPAKNPIYATNTANNTHKNKETAWPAMLARIAELRYTGEGRMLVHSVSYDFSRYLADNLSKIFDHVITYTGAEDRIRALDKFRSGPTEGILVAPSMERGADLKDDQCRINVIPKVPWPNLGDPMIRRRCNLPTRRDGQVWYQCTTARTIIQMAGRAARHENDYSQTWILDQQFDRLLKATRNYLPPDFLARITRPPKS